MSLMDKTIGIALSCLVFAGQSYGINQKEFFIQGNAVWQSESESGEEEARAEVLGDPELAIDYDYLSESYEILEYNICENPQSVYENPLLCEYLQDDLEMEKKSQEMFGSVPATINYFVYDFNDDGLEDYLVIFSGFIWCGTAGDTIKLYVREENGALQYLFSVNARVYIGNGEYNPIVVLNEQKGGYYALVFPWTENTIWSYDTESGEYHTFMSGN